MPVKKSLDKNLPALLPSRNPFWFWQPFNIRSDWRVDGNPICAQKVTRLNPKSLDNAEPNADDHLHKCGLNDSPACDSRESTQMAFHIVAESPNFTGILKEPNDLTPAA